jgi:DEAD/DEAH box helicase domain-containing protein
MRSAAVSVGELVALLRGHERLGPEVVYSATLPAEAARTAELEELSEPLPEGLAAALRASGVPRLYSHQAEGLDAIARGEDLLVTTPTASGKSLVFHLPPLIEAARGGPGKALFLFPLKALGQDQRAKLNALAEAAGLPPEAARAEIYDGDTPSAERARIRRDPPRVLVTNPDMLHLGVLSHWTSWAPLLRDLRWIVLDELHTYRGIFGSHFHHVLQRLLRVCRAEGPAEGRPPTLVASSATAVNAKEFAETLLGPREGRPLRWIERSGAPREARHFVMLRPEASPYTTALHLFAELLRSGAKTIVFTKARRITELLYSWLRRQEPALARRVASYRSGFLPEERRAIEGRLFSGELDGVISTSALELGIDIGGLDACILVGYPGSVMATWQRSGRAGRSGRESLTALVALPDALDQYFLDHPEALLERPCERLIVDPANEQVARAHLVCAAAELPLELAAGRSGGGARAAGAGADAGGARDPYAERHRPLVEELLSQGHLLAASAASPGGSLEVFSARRNPQRQVNLRGTGETYDIVDGGTGELVGTVDGIRVLHECHPGAIYLHGGRQYQVETLDLDRRHVVARSGSFDYFTTPLTEKETEVREVLDRRREGDGLAAWLGRLLVTERVVGFERKRIADQEVLGQEALDLPPVRFETVGLWWIAPRSFEESLRLAGEPFLGALHAAEHAMISLFPVVALCDRGDIGGISYHRHPQIETGAVFVYDGHPGGVGIAARGFRELPDLLSRVLELIAACDCEAGCPSCIQSPKCGNGNRPLDKPGAARVLRLVLGKEAPAAGDPTVWPEVMIPAEAGAELGPAPRPGRDGARPLQAGAEGLSDLADPVQAGAEGLSDLADPVQAGAEGLSDLADPVPRAPEAADLRVGRPFGSESTAPGEAPVLGGAASEVLEGLGRSGRRPRKGGGFPFPPGGREGDRGVERVTQTILFDLETRRSADEVGGWGNCHRMGIALGVALVLEEGRFEVFPEERVAELAELLAGASLVVGFNVKRFDYRVLEGYTGVDYARQLPTLDLLEEVQRRLGFRVGLDALAGETLGAAKSGDGLQCLDWVRQGRMELVEEYCRKDVEILRDLYLYGRRERCVYFHHRKRGRVRVEVDW